MKISQLSDGYCLKFIGFFFLFLIAGRNKRNRILEKRIVFPELLSFFDFQKKNSIKRRNFYNQNKLFIWSDAILHLTH